MERLVIAENFSEIVRTVITNKSQTEALLEQFEPFSDKQSERMKGVIRLTLDTVESLEDIYGN